MTLKSMRLHAMKTEALGDGAATIWFSWAWSEYSISQYL